MGAKENLKIMKIGVGKIHKKRLQIVDIFIIMDLAKFIIIAFANGFCGRSAEEGCCAGCNEPRRICTKPIGVPRFDMATRFAVCEQRCDFEKTCKNEPIIRPGVRVQ